MIFEKLPTIMIQCLLLTVVVEVVVGLIIGVRDKKDILNIILVNVVTNPIVVTVPYLILFKYGLLGRKIAIAILEILVLIVEGFIYKVTFKYKKINPFVVSLILNSGSYIIGEIIKNI